MRLLGTEIAIIEDGRVLLIRETETGLWVLPGGRVEAGESVGQAAVREAREETGLEVRLTRLVGVYSLPRWRGQGQHTVVFAAEPVGGALLVDTDGEAQDAAFFVADALPDPLVWWHQQRIRDALNGVGGGVAWAQDAVLTTAGTPTDAARFAVLAIHPGAGHETQEIGES